MCNTVLPIELELRMYTTTLCKKIIFGGCAKFHPLAILKSNMAANRSPKSLKEPLLFIICHKEIILVLYPGS